MDLKLKDKFRKADLQNFRAILSLALSAGVTDNTHLLAVVDKAIGSDSASISQPTQAGKYRSDNLSVCSVCGAPAVIVAVNTDFGNRIDGEFTHAIQCQNRPASGQVWKPGHCGHTEYITMGER